MEPQQHDKDSSMAKSKSPNSYQVLNGPSLTHSAWFEIRLFYVRIAPCVIDSVPDHLTLCHLRREIGVSLEINGARIPNSDSASLTLRRDRLDKESSEVTYVATDSVRVTGGVEFEVYENNDMVLCGSLERMEGVWLNGNAGMENDSKTGWSMDCYMAASINSGSSAFFRPKLGVSAPSIEVYIAGCCSGVPVILTKTIQISPRRKCPRHATLDAIPEEEEVGKEHSKSCNGLVRQRKVQITESEIDEYESEGKIGHGFYSDEMYTGEDGQLTWFNAGVRVGVGIGLGMCLGIGIGVGLLMRSYQATTSNFRRRFL